MIALTQISCEWGLNGLLESNDFANVIIIIDMLSFSTCIDIAVSNGAYIYPYIYKDESAANYAKEKNAELANSRNSKGFTLSPYSLINIPKDTRLVLPSPNGSTLAVQAKAPHILTGCLRNFSAVAKIAMTLGSRIALIPAGERWSDNSLRIAYEDLICAGAISSELQGDKTEEAKIAEYIYIKEKENNFKSIYNLKSALELIEHNFKKDVDIACEYNVSDCVPILKDDCFINFKEKYYGKNPQSK